MSQRKVDSGGDPIEPEEAFDQATATEQEPEPQVAEEPPEGPSRIAGVASTIAGGASTIATGAGTVISAALSPFDGLASGAKRMIDERGGARVRRVRRMGHHPLVNLWDVHPEARRASIRELGLQSIAVDRVKGTAVEGPPQRGGDFLPLRERRSDDWRSRWQRILLALDRLETLPPVELIKFGDDYWVVDGHNRVAAALYNGQVELDAVVEELLLPGMHSSPGASLAAVMEGSLDLRAAGEGRLTRTARRPEDPSAIRRDIELNAELGRSVDATDHADDAPSHEVERSE